VAPSFVYSLPIRWREIGQRIAAYTQRSQTHEPRLLNEFEAAPTAAAALAADDRAWFAEALRGELQRLGSRVRYEATAQGQDIAQARRPPAAAAASSAQGSSGGRKSTDRIDRMQASIL